MFKQITKTFIVLFVLLISHSIFAEGEEANIEDNTNSQEETIFKLNDVKTLNLKELELNFNFIINKDVETDFIIENSNNDLDEFSVEKTTINGSSIILLLDRDLEKGQDYTINVSVIEGINGELINSGVNGSSDFYVDLDVKEYNGFPSYFEGDIIMSGKANIEEEDNEIINNDIVDNNDIIDNSIIEVENNENIEPDQGGIEIEAPDLNSAATIAEDADDLPQTGPEHWILLLVTLIITMFVFLKKSSSRV